MRPRKKSRKFSEAEFEKLLKEVSQDITALHLHDHVFTGIVENLQRFPSVADNFPCFFGAFYSAIRTDFIIRLGRIYDPEGTGRESCTLARCLHVPRDNAQFFTDQAITARLREDYRKANPNYLTAHRVDHSQITNDLDRIERNRKRLVNLRHKLYAHKDLETVLSGKRDGFLSSHDEVRKLIQLAHEIWNRCSFTWSASTSSENIFGQDDYRRLFNCLRRGMKTKSFAEIHRWDRVHKRRQRG